MNPEAVWGIASLFGIAWLFYGPWQSVCTYYARQVLFEQRDQIFDLARSGELSFDAAEYRTIRSSLEKSIRFAHELTLPRFFLFRWYLRRANLKRASSDLSEAVAAIGNPQTRDKVARLVGEAHMAIVLMMMAKSPLTVLLSLALGALSYFRVEFANAVGRWARPFGEMAQMEAEYAPVRTRPFRAYAMQ